MARTLNESLRKRRGGPTTVGRSSSSKPSSASASKAASKAAPAPAPAPAPASASSEQPQDTSIHKRKSELEQWLYFGTKKSKRSAGAPSLITIESSDDESARMSTRDESSTKKKLAESETQLPTPRKVASSSATLAIARVASTRAKVKVGTSLRDPIEIDESDGEDDNDVIEIDDDDDNDIVVVGQVTLPRARPRPSPVHSNSIQPSPAPSSSIHEQPQPSPCGSINPSRNGAGYNSGHSITGDRLYTEEHYKTGMVKCHARTYRGSVCTRVALKGPLCLTHHDIAKKNGGELPELYAPDPHYNQQKDPAYIAFMQPMEAAEEKGKGNTKKGADRRRCLCTTDRGTRCAMATYQDFSVCKRHLKFMNVPLSHGDAPSVAETERTSRRDKDSIETDSRSVASKSTGADNSDSPRKDKNYKVGQGKVRCEATSQRGKVCRYNRVADTKFCFLHADSELKQAHVPHSATKSMDSDSEEDDDSTSLASSKSSFLPFKWAGSDDPSQKDNRSSVARAPEDDSDDSSMASGDESDDNDPDRPYTHKEFLEMWHICEAYCGETAEDIENTRLIRGANSKMAPEDSVGQQKAQYGRLLPVAMKKLMGEILLVRKDDVFLDIGHGIGNTCIQAAFTVGCEARGIEVVYGRNSVGEVFRDNLVVQNADRPVPRTVGKVDLRYGRLEDLEHQSFLTKGVTRAYVNNFNGVFAERSQNLNQKWFLDDYCAALFALMAPGAVLVTLHPLNLGQTRSEANDSRVKKGLNASKNSSFYEVEKVLLGKACDSVKWNQHSGNKKNIYVYKYSRVTQLAGDGRGVFLCSNPACTFAKDEVAQPATTSNEENNCVINNCACKVTQKTLRRQRRKVYTDP